MRHMHTQMIHIFQHVLASHQRREFERTVAQLEHFDRELRSYLGHEEAEFEDYMNYRIAGDATHLLKMRQVRARLRQLARQVHEMLQPMVPGRVNPARSSDFDLTFMSMSKHLGDCIDTSELELMPLILRDANRGQWTQPAAAAVREPERTESSAEPRREMLWPKASNDH